MPDDYLEEGLTYEINGAGFEVYNNLGYGLLEHVYVQALERELRSRDLRVSREYAARIFYKGQPLTTQRLDLVVDERVIVEVKASERLDPFASRQLFNYLCATSFEIGLLLHFGPRGLGRFRLFQSNERKPHRDALAATAEEIRQGAKVPR
jgi:GxxExxY protein